MVLIVEEVSNYSGATVFVRKYIDSFGKVLSEKLISYKSIKIRDINKTEYILVYDTKCKPISNIFRFINIEKSSQSPNTKEMYAVALKLLFSFCDLFDIDYKAINKRDITHLKDFLYGISRTGNNVELKLKTSRSPETINNYFAIYRTFFRYLGDENTEFHKKVTSNSFKGTVGLLGHARKEVKLTFSANEKVIKQDIVPMYISSDQFRDILLYIRKNYSRREECIIRLMYETGMRIGEVFGLTLEDIVTDPEEYTLKELDDVGRINIVNRLSDQNYQLAKTCFIPKCKEDYNTKYYEEEFLQFVTPSISLLLLIEKYLEDSHGVMSKVKRSNYYQFAAADSLNSENTYLEKGNYYLFLNKNGEPLSQSGWNKILREIFSATGIKIDKGIRRHNLSHRFRHGFAMYLIKNKKYGEVQLMKALRHKSLSSVKSYYNPTIEDIYEANKSASESLHECIPELWEDTYIDD